MIELTQELDTASSLLHDAIQRYVTACYAIKNYYAQTTELSGVPRGLSDRVAGELVSATSYEMEVKRARSAISQARNCSPTVTPIHTLPTEVLARVFQIVVGARPCNTGIKDECHTNIHIPKYPDFLSHVCSRWRHIALGLPALWSHIDLVYSHSLSRGFVSRAEACAVRAGHLPLNIHVRQALEDADDETIFDFLAAFAKRIRSLELAVPIDDTTEDFETSVLKCLLGTCTPGVFTKLTITDRSGYPQFIKAQARNPEEFEIDFRSIWVPLATKRFEQVMLPVTVLRLHGLFPPWASHAYRGLVELHLTCSNTPRLKISQSELYQILDNSPRLRVLEFGLDMSDPPPESSNTLNSPLLCLADLEVLTLDVLGQAELKVLLSFIAPGSNPLQMSVYYEEKYSQLAEEHELVRFFKRSNITRLYIGGDGPCPPLGELINLLPNLSVLVLDFFGDYGEQGCKLSQGPNQHDLSTPSKLHTVYLKECRLDFNTLKQAIEKYSIQELVFWESGVDHNGETVPSDQVEMELCGLCPVVTIIPDGDPNPVEHWD